MATGVSEAPYTRDILRLAAAVPHRVGFDEVTDGVELRSKTCGSRVCVAVSLDPDGKLLTLRQAVEACAFGQAAAAIMARSAHGRDATDIEAAARRIERWLKREGDAPDGWDDLEILEPALERRGRHEAIVLPFRALAAAMREAGG